MLPTKEKMVSFPRGPVVKNLPVNVEDTRDTGLIPESGRPPGEGNGNPLQPGRLQFTGLQRIRHN